MKKVLFLSLAFVSTWLFSLNCQQKKAVDDSYVEVLNAFSDPPAEFRSAPLWVWNERVTKEQIETQLADFRAHGIGGVFIHPRPGSFQRGAEGVYPAGSSCSVAGYGLFEDFKIVVRSKE